jgi:predicted GNAT family N-acyltransferase
MRGQSVTALAYQIRRAHGPDDVSAALDLRYEVFCLEQGVPPREERDGRDEEGLHLVAIADGEVVGTCRLVFTGSTVQFSRLAVRPHVRRHGIATALLAEADREARLGDANRLVLHAQTYALPLYERAGYRTRGRVFVEADIEHVAMEKLL